MAKRSRPSRDNTDSLSIDVRPWGPTTEQLSAIGRSIVMASKVRAFLRGGSPRLLFVEPLEEPSVEKPTRPVAPRRFRTTIYDDAGERTVLAEGNARGGEIVVRESAIAPPPTAQEFSRAVELVRGDPAFATALDSGALVPYRPIPALVLNALPDGRVQRRIAVGLLPRDRTAHHEIVAADVVRGAVLRFAERGPETARPQNQGLCGVPQDANQPTAGKGTLGQVWVTVRQGATTLWRFLAVRPAASSGTNGSGIDLRFVDYRGKRVLYRAHVPILNVKYDNDACGPYRDWQYQEGMIEAQGRDVGPGFRLCPTPARTIMDTGSDTGNFLGVGIYVQGSEVVLVSEMEAGWYRYVSEWRLAADGTIRPRFGFAAVESTCVCNVHHHHVYWRLDFDIRTAGRNRVSEYNNPPLFGGGNWHDKLFEIRRPRDFARQRRWRVAHTPSGDSYEIVPQAADGVATAEPDSPFGRGDVWILRYRSTEIDDGSVATGPPYEAELDRWVNGESVSNRDVVIWYGAHFTHDVQAVGPAQHGHIVGPDLRPVKW